MQDLLLPAVAAALDSRVDARVPCGLAVFALRPKVKRFFIEDFNM